jgi:hypothetical protein
MNKLIREIEQTNKESITETSKLLRGLHYDIQYFNKIGNKRELANLLEYLEYYLSINTNEACQNWITKKYYDGLISLVRMCKELR